MAARSGSFGSSKPRRGGGGSRFGGRDFRQDRGGGSYGGGGGGYDAGCESSSECIWHSPHSEIAARFIDLEYLLDDLREDHSP